MERQSKPTPPRPLPIQQPCPSTITPGGPVGSHSCLTKDLRLADDHPASEP